MKINDFIRMYSHCREQYGIKNDEKVYICLSWKDGEYHPIILTDSDGDKTLIVVSSTERLTDSTYCGPQPIYIFSDAYREHQVVHKTMKLVGLSAEIDEERYTDIKFLISDKNLPQNVIGEINPHRTSMVENTDGDRFIVFRWDTRDSGDGPDNAAEFKFTDFKTFNPKAKEALFKSAVDVECCENSGVCESESNG